MKPGISLEWKPRFALSYRTPKDVCFVSGDEFLKIAAKAYSQAVQAMVPPRGESWLTETAPGTGCWVLWATPEDFHDALLRELSERLRSVAIRRCEMQRVPIDLDTLEPLASTESAVSIAGGGA